MAVHITLSSHSIPFKPESPPFSVCSYKSKSLATSLHESKRNLSRTHLYGDDGHHSILQQISCAGISFRPRCTLLGFAGPGKLLVGQVLAHIQFDRPRLEDDGQDGQNLHLGESSPEA